MINHIHAFATGFLWILRALLSAAACLLLVGWPYLVLNIGSPVWMQALGVLWALCSFGGLVVVADREQGRRAK